MWGALLNALIPGITAAAGFLGGKPKTSTQDSTTTRNFNSNSQQTLGEGGDAFMQALMNQLAGRQDSSGANLGNYVNAGIDTINSNAGTQSDIVQKMLTERGIRGPAAAFASASPELNRVNAITRLQTEAPLAMADQQRADFSQGLQLFGMLPRGTSSTGTETSTGKQSATGPDTSWSDMFSGLGQGMASTYGYNARLKQLKAGGGNDNGIV